MTRQYAIGMAAIARGLSSRVRAGACYAVRMMWHRVAWLMVVALGCPAPDAWASGDAHPLVAVIGANEGTETTDFIVPYAVLTASGRARVVDVSVHDGPIQMMPALKLSAKETIASFDAKYPSGANYVIVPAVHNVDNPALITWLQHQASRGATIVGVCDGVLVVAAANLLDHRAATGHWYSRATLERNYPRTTWVRDRRYVQDGPIMTTTGVTASLPASLALVEQIAGVETADALAQQMGAPGWSPAHASDHFHLTAGHALTALWNLIAFWRYERVGVVVAPGVDEISLSFTADALGRTYRSTALTVAQSPEPIVTKRGLTLIPDLSGTDPDIDRVESVPDASIPPAQALDHTLATIASHDGERTARFVALQLEYEWP